MSSVTRLLATSPWNRCWGGIVLLVLLLAWQAYAADCPPEPPSDAGHASAAQVQLDIVLVRMRHGLARNLAAHVLKPSRATTAQESSELPPPIGVVPSSGELLGFLEVLREEHLVQVVAEPRLVTVSDRQASFLAGGEQAIPVPAGTGQVGVQFEEFGTRLNFIPLVLGNGRIRLESEAEVSNLDPAAGVRLNGTVVPGRTTNRINVTWELKPEQTLWIGGLKPPGETKKVNRIPRSGSLPIIGRAFSPGKRGPEEVELIVLVTPRLLSATPRQPRPPEFTPSSTGYPSGSKQDGGEDEATAGKEAREHLERLERKLKRLQKEVEDLQSEIRPLHPTAPAPSGGP